MLHLLIEERARRYAQNQEQHNFENLIDLVSWVHLPCYQYMRDVENAAGYCSNCSALATKLVGRQQYRDMIKSLEYVMGHILMSRNQIVREGNYDYQSSNYENPRLIRA